MLTEPSHELLFPDWRLGSAFYLLFNLHAGLSLVRPHMLRYLCGCYLVNKGYGLRLIQDHLDYPDPKHITHYIRTAASRFEGLWRR